MNKTILIGRLTKDAELRYTNSNTAVASFTLAVDRTYKNKDGNKESDFINCVAWNKTAEIISNYTNKGSQIAIFGRIQTRNYEANDGTKRFTTEVVAEEVKLLDSNKNKSTNQSDSPALDSTTDDIEGFDEINLDLPF